MATSGSRSPSSVTTALWRATRKADRTIRAEGKEKPRSASSGVSFCAICNVTAVNKSLSSMKQSVLHDVGNDPAEISKQGQTADTPDVPEEVNFLEPHRGNA